jgi:redox-sensitive bicupin YhaK (pirin superfamily)
VKKILGTSESPRGHWVGDGFPVRTMFSSQSHGRNVSPFLMLDHAGPMDFPPGTQKRGVGEHPHRGFETVTIVYEGEVEHRDSTGAGGLIGPGDVQWMTAASGILHDEFHSEAFTREGGTLEMMQLWVNLPAKHKMAAPGYQTIVDGQIPSVELPKDAGRVRVIAGDFNGTAGPARTFTPMDVWDLRLARDGTTSLVLPEGRSVILVVLKGTILVNGAAITREGDMTMLGREGREVEIEANSEATVLLLSGEPIDEPVVAHGPFVMNTAAEIRQAIDDFHSGQFGQIAAAPAEKASAS